MKTRKIVVLLIVGCALLTGCSKGNSKKPEEVKTEKATESFVTEDTETTTEGTSFEVVTEATTE